MKTTKQKSAAQEARGAKLFGGHVTAGSGNQWHSKNDVKTPDLSVEYKYTDKASFSLKVADLETANKYALMDGRTMLFGISYSGRNYVVMAEEDLHSIYRGETGWR